MDVHCSTCKEPWDVDHLWVDAIYETDLSEGEIEAWQRLPRLEKLSDHYREKLRSAGWEFGNSVINVIRCPCCPADAKPDPVALGIKAVLEDILGDDEDGLAAEFEDYGL